MRVTWSLSRTRVISPIVRPMYKRYQRCRNITQCNKLYRIIPALPCNSFSSSSSSGYSRVCCYSDSDKNYFSLDQQPVFHLLKMKDSSIILKTSSSPTSSCKRQGRHLWGDQRTHSSNNPKSHTKSPSCCPTTQDRIPRGARSMARL